MTIEPASVSPLAAVGSVFSGQEASGAGHAADSRAFSAALVDIRKTERPPSVIPTVSMPPSRPTGHAVLDTLARFGSSAERLNGRMEVMAGRWQQGRPSSSVPSAALERGNYRSALGSSTWGGPVTSSAATPGPRLASLAARAPGLANSASDAGDAAGGSATPGPAERSFVTPTSPDFRAMDRQIERTMMFSFNLMAMEVQTTLFGKATKTPGRIIDTLIKQNG